MLYVSLCVKMIELSKLQYRVDKFIKLPNAGKVWLHRSRTGQCYQKPNYVVECLGNVYYMFNTFIIVIIIIIIAIYVYIYIYIMYNIISIYFRRRIKYLDSPHEKFQWNHGIYWAKVHCNDCNEI